MIFPLPQTVKHFPPAVNSRIGQSVGPVATARAGEVAEEISLMSNAINRLTLQTAFALH